ncbi:MAG TPA: phosphatase PAP2 family protein [Gaiellales bacterium]|nr:phosphatase PAP2 family protein [Gaiellales bacterium]
MNANVDLHQLWGRWPLLDRAMEFSASYVIVLGAAVFMLLWFRRDGLRAGLAGGIGGLVAVGIAFEIGAVWDRTRPFVAEHWVPLISHGRDASFPSDHLAALGALTVGAWMGWRALGGVVGLIALVVAVARVYVGVHWPSDVIGGFVIGGLAALVLWYALAAAARPINRIDELLQRHRLRPRFDGGGSAIGAPGARTALSRED